jgi:predicted Zn-dependent peptidase
MRVSAVSGAIRRLAVASALLAVLSQPLPAQVRNWPSESPPRPLSAPSVKFPPYEVRTLDNGMQVVVVSHHEQPAVSVRLIVRAGSANDPEGKPGVSSLLAALLDQGTTSRSAQQLADTIEFVGGLIDTGSGGDLAFAQLIVLKNSFSLGMELLSDVVRNPAFAPEEIERQRQQILSGLTVGYEDPSYVANVVFDRLVYGFHPYGLPGNGTTESLSRITRDDLVAFHETHFAPNNSLLAMVGDVSGEEAFGLAEKVFGGWQRKEVPREKLPAPPSPTRRVVIVDKPDAVQTEIRVGHLGVPRNHRDHMALTMAMKVLGGEGSNRLQRVLRSERGLTYGASADMHNRRWSGSFVAETNTRTEATGEALRVMVDEFARLQRELVHERELADAKAFLAGSFPLRIETPNQIAIQILNALFYELPLKELDTFRNRVNAVGVEDIQRVSRAHLRPDRLSIVMVGNAGAFSDQLRGVGIRNFEVVPLSQLDLFTADLRRPQPDVGDVFGARKSVPSTLLEPFRGPMVAMDGMDPAAVSYSGYGPLDFDVDGRPMALQPGGDEQARAIIARAVEAKGGLETLKQIRTVVARATTTVRTPRDEEAEVETTTYIEYPDRFRVEAGLPFGQVVQTYNRGAAWTVDPRGTRDASVQERRQFEAAVKRDIVALLVRASSSAIEMRTRADESHEGRTLKAVELWGGDLDPVVVHVDAETGDVMRQLYTVDTPEGPQQVEELFSDYRTVNGVRVAYRAEVRRGGARQLERSVTDFQINVPIADNLFRKPR